MKRCALGATVFLLLCTPVQAHERSVSYSWWEIDRGHVEVTARFTERDLTRFAWWASQDRVAHLAEYVTTNLHPLVEGKTCSVSRAPLQASAPAGFIAFRWTYECEGSPTAIGSALLLDVASSHLHFARVSSGSHRGVEAVLSNDQRLLQLGIDRGAGIAKPTGFLEYVRLGVEHIVTGYDHLAFLAALLLVAGSIGAVATVVTGFTVAHSLTLALAVLGRVRPSAPAIEALIGLSIVLVACENVWLQSRRTRALPITLVALLTLFCLAALAGRGSVPSLALAGLALFAWSYFRLLESVSRPTMLRWLIALLFGLVHGFGFAGVLLEIELPPDRLVLALGGFNVGVELGQLAVACVFYPVVRFLCTTREGRWQPLVIEAGSAAVLIPGVYWFVTRTLG